MEKTGERILQSFSYNGHEADPDWLSGSLSINDENDNGIMPPSVGDRSIPEQSAEILPCRSKAQELRSSMSSNSLRFLTPGKAKFLIAFVF